MSQTNMPNFQQRELSGTFNVFGDSTALNVMYVQVMDVSTTNGANWFGTAFDNVTLTGLRVSNADPVMVLGFSNAFANPGQILAAGGPTSEVVSPLQTTPGYTITQASNQFWISTVSGADYGFTSLGNITGANRIRGGGLFQLTFAPYINVAGFDFNFWNVQAEYGNSNQFIPAQLVTPEPSPYLLTLAGLALLFVCRRSRLSARHVTHPQP